MNKDNQKNLKGQEGLFISFELMNKYSDMDIVTASLYGQIKYWATNKEGYCWAGNDKFAKLLRVSDRQIKRMLSYLIDKELITRVLVGNNRKLFIVEMNQSTYTDEVGGHTVPGEGHTVPGGGHTVPGGGHTVPGEGHTVLVIESINKLESKIENKLESNNINYNMQNFDFVEEDKKSGNNIIPTNTPEGGDNNLPEDEPRDLISAFTNKELDEYQNLYEGEDEKSKQEALDAIEELLNRFNQTETDKFKEYQDNKITSTKPNNENWDNVMENNDDYGDTIQF